VDDLPIGNGKRGPITEQIQDQFFGLFSNVPEDRQDWLDFV
jgi:branched-chain amino acid aminotransferase